MANFQEFGISDSRLSKDEARYNINRIIYIYNNERPHLSYDMLTPKEAHIRGNYVYKKWGKYAFNEIWNS